MINNPFRKMIRQADLEVTVLLTGVTGLKRQLHVFFLVCMLGTVKKVMHFQKIQERKALVFFLMFYKMLHKKRQL